MWSWGWPTYAQKQTKNVFFVFSGCFWAYVGQPHDHISWVTLMLFASINQLLFKSILRRCARWSCIVLSWILLQTLYISLSQGTKLFSLKVRLFFCLALKAREIGSHSCLKKEIHIALRMIIQFRNIFHIESILKIQI